MKKIVGIFGASTLGSQRIEEIELLGLPISINCFFDNAPDKWGNQFNKKEILEPTKENLEKVDFILIASCYAEEIIAQIITLGLSEKVCTSIDGLSRALGLKELKKDASEETLSKVKNDAFRSFHAGRPNEGPADNAVRGNMVACTGCANNHLALAKTLAYSFLHFHPDGRFFIFLVDKKQGHIKYPDQEDQRIEVIEAESLNIEGFNAFAFKYDIYELCTALRPYEVDYLLNARGFDSILMIDPDVLITAPLDGLFNELHDTSILLFPHMVSPSEKPASANEINVLRSGVFNCGLLGFKRCEETQTFIKWWQARLDEHCHNAQEKGFFVDQKWMNFVPCLFPKSKIIHDPAYNVAYWNLSERPLLGASGRYTIKGSPLRCFHFSSMREKDWVNPLERINELSGTAYSSKNSINDLLCLYLGIITENGFFDLCREPYAYGFFSNGIPIAPVMRKIFLKRKESSGKQDPFDASGLDSFYTWLNEKNSSCDKVSRLVHEIGDIEGLPLVNPTGRQQKSSTHALARALAHQESLCIDDVFLRNVKQYSNN